MIAILLAIAVYVFNTRNQLVVELIDVPKAYVEKGRTGAVISRGVRDQLKEIYRISRVQTQDDQRVQIEQLILPTDPNPIPDITIWITRIRAFADWLRVLYNPHVTVDLISTPTAENATALLIRVRISEWFGDPNQTVNIVSSEANAELDIATGILKLVNPWVVGKYLYVTKCIPRTDCAEALTTWSEVTNDSPQTRWRWSASHFGIGLIESMLGDLSAAAREFQAAIQMEQIYPQAYYNLGTVWLRQKRFEEATVQLSTAIRQDPSFGFAYSNLASALGQQGKFDEALANAQKATQLDPKDAVSWMSWGLILAGQAEQTPNDTMRVKHLLGEAVVRYRAAPELQPRNCAIYNNWMIALAGLRRPIEEIREFHEHARTQFGCR